MATTLTAKDFATTTPSWWCAGCGDFGVIAALKQAAADMGLRPKDTAFISGIGCSGKISGYFHSYAFHGVHGRALPVATAVARTALIALCVWNYPGEPATALMRAIISSTALSTGTFSLSTRFAAFAQTFSLLSTVNL